MKDPTIRIYFREPSGVVTDGSVDFDLSSFAGFLPCIGDKILNPCVVDGRDRREPANREIWSVVDRVFNPRDLESYVVLVVEERSPTKEETAYVTN